MGWWHNILFIMSLDQKERCLGETKLAADIKVKTTQNICRIHSTDVHRQVLQSLIEITVHSAARFMAEMQHTC